MKPLITYIGMTACTFSSSVVLISFHQTAPAITTLVLGAMAMCSLQGSHLFHRPQWMDGVQIDYPQTGHLLSMAIIIEAATIAAALMSKPLVLIAITVRAIGFFLQLSAIGKTARDYSGGSDQDQICGSVQDETIARKAKR